MNAIVRLKMGVSVIIKLVNNVKDFIFFISALCVAQQSSDDRETHERSSSGGKGQAAQDRRIDILPAEDEDGMQLFV